MSRVLIERKLRSVAVQLRSLRAELEVSAEQLLQLDDEADEARLQAVVSESPAARRRHRSAARHAERLRKHRDRLVGQIAALEAEQDSLLDRLSAAR